MNTDTLKALKDYCYLVENLDKGDKNYSKTLMKVRFQYFINRLQVLCDNQDYENTYENTYKFLNAILYCLGEALEPREFSFSVGFNKWKTVLISHLLRGIPHS